MQNVPIAQVMTPGPATVEPGDSVATAERLMRERRCQHLPVVDGAKVVSMLSAHDLLKALVLRPLDEPDSERTSLEHRRVGEIMQRNVRALSRDATLLDATRALSAGGFHALPIVASDGRVIGIVTSTDIIQALRDDLQRAANGDTPATRAAAPAAPSEELDEPQLKALRDVYRAVRKYLRSGRAEIEHTRLLQAANRAQEALHTASIDL
ncbi:MAG TPA: CBS domain-containing protein [Gammaproteobacteria bacterium]|nr:CBS domain-containing protein [Gammaproteobacteria bacterium]